MANARTQQPANPSWPRKRRREAVQTHAVSAAPVDTTPRRKPFRYLVGRKYIRLLEKFIGDLRVNHPHPNRDLYLDDIVTILLLEH